MTDETNKDTDPVVEKEAPSAFDTFLDNFSSQNLESRVRFVSAAVLGLMLLTFFLAILGLNFDFEVSERAIAEPRGPGRYAFVLDGRFERFLTERPDIFRENGEKISYDEFHVEKSDTGITILIALAGVGELDATEQAWPAKIVFQKKKILGLLLESSREGSDGGVPEI